MINDNFSGATDELLAECIAQQVEWYFLDENITKDAFLLKHVRRNRDGYVSIKLITSFKRVKQLTKNWRLVAQAVQRKSQRLALNEASTKVRRLEPLPMFDETMKSRCIIATNLPFPHRCTIETIAELFNECGEITQVRLLKSNLPMPPDVRSFLNKNPSLMNQQQVNEIVLVEFASSVGARNAIKLPQLYLHLNSMRVFELNHSETKRKDSRVTGRHINNTSTIIRPMRHCLQRNLSTNCPPIIYYCDNHPFVSQRSRRFSTSFTTDAAQLLACANRMGLASPPPPPPPSNLYIYKRNCCCSNTGAAAFSRRTSACSLSSNSTNSSENSATSGCCSRRTSFTYQSNPSVDLIKSRRSSSIYSIHENVVRMPKGPDGTDGFKHRIL